MNTISTLLLLCITTTCGVTKIPFSIVFIQSQVSGNDVHAYDGQSPVMWEAQDQQIRTAVLFALIPVVVAFSFIVFIFYRAKREAFFKQRKAELEIKALRAQINPHFIFNCLNSIHHYMHKHGAQLSGEYLLKFSQLIRYVLETSSQRMVPLQDDLDILKIYMELEQLRMPGCFTFEIVTPREDITSINIPPMMLQPFVENAIWHGLNEKGKGGLIRISIDKKDDCMHCQIEDNGIFKQRSSAESYTTIKKTSMGMAIIRDRLSVVSQVYKVKADFKIENRLTDSVPQDGTRVLVVLPYED